MDDFAAKPTTIPLLAAKLHRWLPQLDWPVEPVLAADENGAGLDATVLDELTGGDPALTASLLSDFLATSRDDLRALAAAVETHDHEQLRRQAHRIVGASRIVGADALAALGKRIENAGAQESGDWADVRSLVDRLDAELAIIAAAIPA